VAPAFLGIDIGTSSTKVCVFEDSGEELGCARVAHKVSAERPGFAESDPEQWWGAVCLATRRALASAGVGRGGVGAIGLSGQMHGVVLTDAGGVALRSAILWPDRRAEYLLDNYRALPSECLDLLGNPLAPGMAGPMLLWLRDTEPNIYSAAAFALQAKDWVRLRLTGEVGSERSDASGTLLYDLGHEKWAEEVVRRLGLRVDLLPSLGDSASVAGLVRLESAEYLGLKDSLPVAYGAADTAAALVGTGITRVGALQLTVGSGAQIVTLRATPVSAVAGPYNVYAAAVSGRVYAMAAVAAGIVFEWAWSTLGCDWAMAYQGLACSPAGANGVAFIPYAGAAGPPVGAPEALGKFVGLGTDHSRHDVVRSVFEGVAFSIKQAALKLPEFCDSEEILVAGGGSVNPLWRQLLADVLGIRLVARRNVNVSARGAARFAAESIGLVLPVGRDDVDAIILPETSARQRLAEAYQKWSNLRLEELE